VECRPVVDGDRRIIVGEFVTIHSS
jgi:hypothetical protein